MTMYFYSNGTQTPVGPVSIAQLHQLADAGTVHAGTPVIEQGETSWKTYGDFPRHADTPVLGRTPSPGGSDYKSMGMSFLNFDRLLAPTFIKVIYFIGLGVIVVVLLVFLAGALRLMGYDVAKGLGTIVASIIAAGAALIGWRLLCELYILFFNIHDKVKDIRDHLRDSVKPA